MTKVKKWYSGNREMYRLLCIMVIWLIFMAFTQSKKFYTGANFLTMAGQFPEYGMMVIGGMLFGAFQIYDQVVNTTEAPYCLDETEADAQRLANRSGLVIEITRTSDAIKPIGTVIMQSPEYGTIMRKGETLCLVVSTGPEEQAIPQLVGKNVDEAREELERVGFTLLALQDRVLSLNPWDTVLSQDPKEGAMMPSGSVVQVAFDDYGIKKLAKGIAPLKKI